MHFLVPALLGTCVETIGLYQILDFRFEDINYFEYCVTPLEKQVST